ncbi:Efflux transporter, RND family, MFP subunit OS=Planctomyces brasiliensis (strain ATCC 49424 / DSM 5305 / JCM 21570 / NBRC 103401 / IFAM 1448) GN=Plabr_2125 PE=4 SV=1: HlyD_2 [Tuwongella immobilis]|uniref:RND efflux pump membrane fusion protein barrel-sandwich domain-containing protein n=1 Tax=Tuwongella immobilis TaxID=692036 RepID=A0A6C2YMN4_9BACT|nr:Efflux transporter, RND family, MFP subunit OS=Planctomyces brasiliensis (strain ATCC 49424 / DSM 5305 / JCM 21570 / NBRC 103401 / IFAM 1448) GN=Plabr_2125 PE=4 SV=1: HlyD_2 [Tuwongella immobilis]VTS01832.1 Efflux transporter, RND family, MFP subunit OS=Planctomyces brasiliensis (strain ATCC 49424 / DSM 5305 / JCM 21570 / NBRC 103401 / IFAM 1448) GN=Plabr_2125 PE=4 SV=1: HlyD_2 [Tuwongella immobilis]
MLILAGGGFAAKTFLLDASTDPKKLILHTLERGTLQVSIVQRGALESSSNRDIVCRVKAGARGGSGASTIKWVIDDGTEVKAGQKVMELDSSALEDERRAQQITLDTAQAAYTQAVEEYRIVVNQNFSDIETARVTISLAALDLEKYTGLPRDSVEKMSIEELLTLDLEKRVPAKGEYRQLLDDVSGRLRLAESDVEMLLERAAWSERMVKKGYLTPSQANAERSRLESSRETLKKLQMESEVLQVFTKRRMETELKNKLIEAKRALERTIAQAKAKEAKADSDRITKKSIFEQELTKIQEIDAQIAECTLYSPQAGMVVYYVPEQVRFGGGNQQSIIAQGEFVREGQKMIRIPDLNHMLVNMRVHESMVMNLRGEVWRPTGFSEGLTQLQQAFMNPLIPAMTVPSIPSSETVMLVLREQFRAQDLLKVADGQPATVKIEAFPNRALKAHVKSVATVATQDFMTPEVKMFQTLIEIDESLPGLKPGMSAEVVIKIEDPLVNVLLLPTVAVVGGVEMGNTRRCFVMTPNGPEERTIEIGLSNATQVEIRSGLNEGDQVILNPSVLVSDGTRTRDQEAPAMSKSGMGRGGEGGPKGGKDGKGPRGPGGAPGSGGPADGASGAAGKNRGPGKAE